MSKPVCCNAVSMSAERRRLKTWRQESQPTPLVGVPVSLPLYVSIHLLHHRLRRGGAMAESG